MRYTKELDYIYKQLNDGKCFGYWAKIVNPVIKTPYISDVLYITPCGNIGWTHYGSSANKNTRKDLKWILEVIFQMSPKDFLEKYICH